MAKLAGHRAPDSSSHTLLPLPRTWSFIYPHLIHLWISASIGNLTDPLSLDGTFWSHNSPRVTIDFYYIYYFYYISMSCTCHSWLTWVEISIMTNKSLKPDSVSTQSRSLSTNLFREMTRWSGNFVFLGFYLFIHERHTERGRDICKGRSRFPRGSLMQDLIPGPGDHVLSWRHSTTEPPRHPGQAKFLFIAATNGE